MADLNTGTLALSGVTKTFSNGSETFPVLDGLDWTIPAGGKIAVVGASGVGKSTLLNIMGTLDRPDAGTVHLDGKDLFAADADHLAEIRNRKIGFVFQFHHLLPEFTALENVMMPTRIAGIRPEEAMGKAVEVLDRVGLSHRIHHRVVQLSGGEQQRAALARALVMEPSLLLADEPTGNLDTRNSDSVHELLREVNAERRMTLVVVTHNMALAKLMDGCVTLEHGRILNV